MGPGTPHLPSPLPPNISKQAAFSELIPTLATADVTPKAITRHIANLKLRANSGKTAARSDDDDDDGSASGKAKTAMKPRGKATKGRGGGVVVGGRVEKGGGKGMKCEKKQTRKGKRTRGGGVVEDCGSGGEGGDGEGDGEGGGEMDAGDGMAVEDGGAAIEVEGEEGG